MSPRVLLVPLLGWLVLTTGGCANVLSRTAMEKVDPALDFAQVKADPAAHQGHTLLLAGLIVDNRTDREGTTLELLHYFADRWGAPTGPDEAGGRFLVQSKRFLDPELYRRGLFATLTGTVAGSRTLALQGKDYTYPLFTLDEIHLWRPSQTWYGPPGSGYYPPYGPSPYWPYWWYGPVWGGPYWYDPDWDYPYRYRGGFWFNSRDN